MKSPSRVPQYGGSGGINNNKIVLLRWGRNLTFTLWVVPVGNEVLWSTEADSGYSCTCACHLSEQVTSGQSHFMRVEISNKGPCSEPFNLEFYPYKK